MGDPLGALDLDAEQQLALRVERPGIAALRDIPRRDPPDRRRRVASEPRPRVPTPSRGRLSPRPRPDRRRGAAHALERRGERRIDALRDGADSGRPRRRRGRRRPIRPGTAAPRARRAPGSGGTASRWRAHWPRRCRSPALDDHRRRAVARARRPAVDQPAHVLGEARHVEGAVLHADIDVVGPGAARPRALARGSARGRCAGRRSRSPGPAPAARSPG